MAFAVDLHTHTRHGSNCAYTEPRALVARAREVGLDGVCITEHNAPWEEEALLALADGSSLHLFAAVEVGTEWGDVLVFGVGAAALEARGLGGLRQMVDEAGGFIVAAHPFRRGLARGHLPAGGLDARQRPGPSGAGPSPRPVQGVDAFRAHPR